MAYRTAAAIATPARARHEPVFAVRSRSFLVNMAIPAICALVAFGTLSMTCGTSVECARTSEGATPECEASESGWLVVIDASSKKFAGTPEALRANDTTVTDDTDATELVVDDWHTRPIDPIGAKAVAHDYEAFVADPKARSFDRRVRGGFGSFLLIAMMSAVALSLFAFARRLPSGWALIIDRDGGELVWETRYWRRPVETVVFPLSEITKVDVESVDDSDAYELFVDIGGVQRKVCRASESACRGAAVLIARAIEESESKEPDAEASGSESGPLFADR